MGSGMGGGMILLAGCLAAGKSTFSKRLADALNIPCFNKDRVKEILSDDIGFTDRASNKRLSLAAMDMMTHAAETLCARGVPLILESNFHMGEGERLAAIAAAHGCPVLTYLFDGDKRALYDRFQARLDSPERHAAHKSQDFVDYDTFIGYAAELTAFAVGDEIVRVDATDFDTVDYDGLVAQARAFLARG